MPRFRMDNTEGYTADDLKMLNEAFDFIAVDAEEIDDEVVRKSFLDRCAESLCRRFDSGKRTLGDLLMDPISD